MSIVLPGLRMVGISGALPPNVTELSSLASEFGDEYVQRAMTATGIRRVRVASPGQCASDLCEDAAQRLLQVLGLSRQSIDAIVFVSQTPDNIMPATSVQLQHRLGLEKRCLAFDINYGCSGFVYGLLQCALLVSTGACRRALLLVGDVLTRHLNRADKANRMVFGDGGAAAIVESGHDTWHFQTMTDGGGASSLIIPAGGARLPLSEETAIEHKCGDGYPRTAEQLHMQGTKVLNFALREVPSIIEGVVASQGYALNDVDLVGLHQANHYVVRTIRRTLELPERVVPSECSDFGNTGPASIPLLLCARGSELTQMPSLARVVLCGFGAGYSVAAVGLSLVKTLFLPPIISEATRKPLLEEARSANG